jgi:hypothetical protein
MNKVLVCVNDGLLKIRLDRLLSEKNISHTITSNPIKRNELILYSYVIIHSSYKLTDLYKFVENIITGELITVIYITSNPASNRFIKFKDNPHLILIDENKMDVELNLAINIYNKLQNNISTLQNKSNVLEKKLKSEKLMAKCKRFLMNQGLSEDEAHKEILKYSMDNKISKDEACNRLMQAKNG